MSETDLLYAGPELAAKTALDVDVDVDEEEQSGQATGSI